MQETVALIGLDPFQIDFSNPDHSRFAHASGRRHHVMLEKDKATLISLGFDAELIFSAIDVADARPRLETALRSKPWGLFADRQGRPFNPRVIFNCLMSKPMRDATSMAR